MSITSRKQGLTRQNFSKKNLGGFTLVEMIVSLGLFTIILFISTSAFLTVVNADRKSRSVRIATDNLNLALEDMQRRIKTGSYYFCGEGGESSLTAFHDFNGAETFSFTEQDGKVRTTYRRNNYAIERQHLCLSAPCTADLTYSIWIPITSPEIRIDRLRFTAWRTGPGVGDSEGGMSSGGQPWVTLLIGGKIGASPASPDFLIQSVVAQRNYDN